MFGTDSPHMEGTWPNTKDWLRVAFAGVPENEVRLILGENAIRFYELDPAQLQNVAERVGPELTEISTGAQNVRPDLLRHFDERAGFRKLPKFNEEELARVLDEDATAVRQLERLHSRLDPARWL